MALPSNISYGTVTGQFLAAVADGPDDDKLPEGIPMSGTVTFTPSTPYVYNFGASPNPVTIIKTSIVCQLDSEGYLCSPYKSVTSPLSRGVTLVATDDPDITPSGWTWTAIYNLTDPNGMRVNMPNHSFLVPGNQTVDLTTAAPLISSGGTIITRGPANTLTIGTVTTVDSSVPASATITGEAPNQVLNLAIPRGAHPLEQAVAFAIAL